MKMMDKAVDLLYKRIHDLDTLETHFQQQLREVERDRDDLHELCRKDKALIHQQCVQLQGLRLQERQLRAQLTTVEVSDRDCRVRCGQLQDTVARLQDRLQELQIHEQRLLELLRHLKVTEKLWPRQPSVQEDVRASPCQLSTQELCIQSQAQDFEKESVELTNSVQDLEKIEKASEHRAQVSDQDAVSSDLASQLQQSVGENLGLWHQVSHQHAQLELLHSQLSASGQVALDLQRHVDMLQDRETCLLEQVRTYQSRDMDLQSRVEELEKSEGALKVKVSELQHRENCLLARLLEYDTVGSQVLDTLPLAQKQQLPQTLEACQRRVLVLTRLLEDAQRELQDSDRQPTQTDTQPSNNDQEQREIQKQRSGSHRLNARKSEDVQWQVCDNVRQQEQLQEKNHLQTEHIQEQLSDYDHQQEQGQRQHEEAHQDNMMTQTTNDSTHAQQSDTILQQQARDDFCEDRLMIGQELHEKETDFNDAKRIKAIQQQLIKSNNQEEHVKEQFCNKIHQKTENGTQQLPDDDNKYDKDYGSQPSENDPKQEKTVGQHEKEHQDDSLTEAVKQQLHENCYQQTSAKSLNQDLAQSHHDDSSHHLKKYQEDREKIASISKSARDAKREDKEARDEEGNEMIQGIKQKARQRQEKSQTRKRGQDAKVTSQQTTNSARDIVELFEDCTVHNFCCPLCLKVKHLWLQLLRIHECRNKLLQRIVIYLNGRVSQQPHNPALSSATIHGVRWSRDPARAQQRLAIETLTASGQASPRLQLLMALQGDGHSADTALPSPKPHF